MKQREEIEQFFSGLLFNEEYHKYSIDNKILDISVSGLLNKIKRDFEKQSISKAIAIRDNRDQEEILKSWKEKADNACSEGTKTHKFAEIYGFSKKLKPSSGFEKAIVKLWSELPKHIIPVLPELQMYHKKYLFGGTLDLLLYDTIQEGYIIGDYKTNKDLFKNYRGQTLKDEFSFLLQNSFNIYQLQLSLYQILLEQLSDIRVIKRKIIWVKNDGSYELLDTKDYTNELKEFLKRIYNNGQNVENIIHKCPIPL